MLGFHLPHRGLCAEWISCLNSWFIFTLWHHTSHNVSQFLYRINGIKNGLFSSSSHKSTFFSFAFESWFLINFSHCKKLKWRQAWFICLFHEFVTDPTFIWEWSCVGDTWGEPPWRPDLRFLERSEAKSRTKPPALTQRWFLSWGEPEVGCVC